MTRLVPLLLFALLLLGSSVADPAEWVDTHRMIKTADWQVSKRLADSRCKAAFTKYFPGYTEDIDLVEVWSKIKYAVVEDIPKMPFARGATQCDISQDTFVMAEDYISWGSQRDITEVMIHEFVHLLRCPVILDHCGSQSNCAPSVIANEERLAYQISGECTN